MARSGAHTLRLLAVPLNGRLLHSLATGPKLQAELRRETGSPASSTLRSHLRSLERLGVIVKHRHAAFPGSLEYELAGPGVELLFVLSILEAWLSRAPAEPLDLGDGAARAAIQALVEGWSSSMLGALATQPLTLTQLDRRIGSLNYPSLERRLTAMRHAGLVEPMRREGSGTPFAATEWLRLGIGPLVAASRWEGRCLIAESTPIGRIDAEAALMLALPLVRSPREASGVCRLSIELDGDDSSECAVVTVQVEDGRTSLLARLDGRQIDASASGAPNAWFRTAIEADSGHLELGGDNRLARGLLGGLYDALFGWAILRRS